MQPNLEWQEPALGANALAVQGGQALAANSELSQHAKHAYYIDYRVNDDGRTRAVVRTYPAGRNEDGKTVVDSFANTFPTGQSGNTNEVPYKARFSRFTQTVTSLRRSRSANSVARAAQPRPTRAHPASRPHPASRVRSRHRRSRHGDCRGGHRRWLGRQHR